MYKRIFWFFVVLCVALSSTALASEPNLVGWWKLDGNANDSSGNGLDGTARVTQTG